MLSVMPVARIDPGYEVIPLGGDSFMVLFDEDSKIPVEALELKVALSMFDNRKELATLINLKLADVKKLVSSRK